MSGQRSAASLGLGKDVGIKWCVRARVLFTCIHFLFWRLFRNGASRATKPEIKIYRLWRQKRALGAQRHWELGGLGFWGIRLCRWVTPRHMSCSNARDTGFRAYALWQRESRSVPGEARWFVAPGLHKGFPLAAKKKKTLVRHFLSFLPLFISSSFLPLYSYSFAIHVIVHILSLIPIPLSPFPFLCNRARRQLYNTLLDLSPSCTIPLHFYICPLQHL